MISRLASSAVVLGLLVLPTSYAAAGPMTAQLRRHPAAASAGETGVAVSSHGLIVASAMTDRLKQHDVFPGAQPSRAQSDRHPRRGWLGGGSGKTDLRDTDSFPRDDSGGGPPSTPIPEPSSILMLGGGAALVGFAIRRKLA